MIKTLRKHFNKKKFGVDVLPREREREMVGLAATNNITGWVDRQ